jgi:enoyl-[acyl-carrier protein] reductase I
MYTIDLSGKTGLIVGVANKRSNAWAIAQLLHQAGVRLAFTYQNERLRPNVEELTAPLGDAVLMPCEVTDEAQVEAVFRKLDEEFGKLNFLIHSIAYAEREDLDGMFFNTSQRGFHTALDISSYSLIHLTRQALPLLEKEGGCVLTLTFIASERVFPTYNVMGTAKAALEHIVRQLAFELGEKNIRVNAISAGPVSTLAARGIPGFTDFLHLYREKAPMKRNIDQSEVAKAALFLCSDLASAITGEVLHVDAGYHILGF